MNTRHRSGDRAGDLGSGMRAACLRVCVGETHPRAGPARAAERDDAAEADDEAPPLPPAAQRSLPPPREGPPGWLHSDALLNANPTHTDMVNWPMRTPPVFLSVLTLAASGTAGANAAPAPAQTIAYCPEPSCSKYLIVEAENFTVVGDSQSGWSPHAWAHDPNLFASDVSNVFMNRRAYLHAGSIAPVGGKATAAVTVPADGNYTLLARYEAGYRFSSPFNVTVQQGGDARVVYQQAYGLRSSPKVWGFAGCTDRYGGLAMLSAECRYNYGTTENMVWEGPSLSGNYTLSLQQGLATITLTVADAHGDITERNIDTLLLTMNTSDIAMRLAGKSRPLQLDGLIGTQEGEVFAKMESHEDQEMNITLPLTSSRSPLWEGKLIYPVVSWKCTHVDPKNRTSPENCTQSITTGCGTRGMVSVAPPPPDLKLCQACAANYSLLHNCTAAQQQQACAPAETGLLQRSKASRPCETKLMRAQCFPKPAKPTPPLPLGMSQCVTFRLGSRQKTDWVDVGRVIDTMNHASWNLPAGNYTLTIGMKDPATGHIEELGVFPSGNAPLQILTDASTRASRRMRPRAADFWELYAKLKALEPQLPGKPPTSVPVFASTYQRDMPQGGLGAKNGTGRPDPKYKAAQSDFEAMFGISPVDVNEGVGSGVSKDAWRTQWGYLDLRGYVPKNAASGQDKLCGLDGRATECVDGYGRRGMHIDTIDQARARPAMTLEQKLQTYIDAGVGDKIRAIKLGDEIGLPKPSGNDTDTLFHDWARQQGLTAPDIGCKTFDQDCGWNTSIGIVQGNPSLFYYSNKYKNDFGIDSTYRNATAIITKMLPNALAGANYGPTSCAVPDGSCMSYLPETFKWIRAFRAGTFTLPFTEDYIFQQPPGTQQMYTLVVDVERAAVRPQNKSLSSALAQDEKFARVPPPKASAELNELPVTAQTPGRPIMQYVMAHYPGNTPTSWRRQFYGDLAHGVKYIHLYVFAGSQSSPAGDYVDADGGTFEQVLRATHELGQWDDILADSVPHAAGVKVALLFSETGDIFLDTYGTAGAAKRSLYIALVHSQVAIDVVTEDDLVDGTLQEYAVLYLCHAHVNDAASTAVAGWVKAGGTVVSSVVGGMRNQLNQTNAALSTVFGADASLAVYSGTRPSGVDNGNRIDFIKQDLAFAEVLDTVTVSFTGPDGNHELGNLTVVGEKTVLGRPHPADATVLATFDSDGSTAAYSRAVGQGKAVFFAFYPGLSYFLPAIPKKPVSRGSTDECFNHWVPRDFNVVARTLVAAPALTVPGAAPVLSSEARVDIGVLAAAGKGTVLPVTNWAGNPLKGLELTLQFKCQFSKAALASGGTVTTTLLPSGFHKFVFDLEVADALILRV